MKSVKITSEMVNIKQITKKFYEPTSIVSLRKKKKKCRKDGKREQSVLEALSSFEEASFPIRNSLQSKKPKKQSAMKTSEPKKRIPTFSPYFSALF